MNFYIKIFYLLLISVIPLNAQDVFKLKLHISKSIYIVGEPVQVGVSLVNISSKTIEGESLGYTELKLIDENGQYVKRGGWSSTSWGPYKNKLTPGEEDYNVFLLNDYFGKNFQGWMFSKQYDPGTYTIKAEFFPNNQNYDRVIDQVTFKVIEPLGDELIVYNRFIDILEQEYQNNLNQMQTANALRSLYESYQNSVYSPLILLYLKAMYHITLAEGNNTIWAAKELVEKHSSAVNAIYQLNWLLDQMRSESEKIEYIRMIKTKSEGTLMEKMYEQRIKELKRIK